MVKSGLSGLVRSVFLMSSECSGNWIVDGLRPSYLHEAENRIQHIALHSSGQMVCWTEALWWQTFVLQLDLDKPVGECVADTTHLSHGKPSDSNIFLRKSICSLELRDEDCEVITEKLLKT